MLEAHLLSSGPPYHEVLPAAIAQDLSPTHHDAVNAHSRITYSVQNDFRV